ncbi:hypothetical protein H4R34_004038 [Dimargaris verticillata]|uniref:Uncharacterized protein n=1 Tax=Dimargaris verticillata TaxID=2761393 RepID=A0A9W8B5Q6_9FUNG|nr:hypothetical protein H4R34_004038 [Dimargaris verticillata]
MLSQHPQAGHRPRGSTEGPPGLPPTHSRKPYHPPTTTSSYRSNNNGIVLPRQPATAAHPAEFTTSTTAALPMLSNAPFAPPRLTMAGGGGGDTTRAPVGSLRRYNEEAALKQEVNQLLNQAHNTTPGTYVGKLSNNNNMLIPVLPRIAK